MWLSFKHATATTQWPISVSQSVKKSVYCVLPEIVALPGLYGVVCVCMLPSTLQSSHSLSFSPMSTFDPRFSKHTAQCTHSHNKILLFSLADTIIVFVQYLYLKTTDSGTTTTECCKIMALSIFSQSRSPLTSIPSSNKPSIKWTKEKWTHFLCPIVHHRGFRFGDVEEVFVGEDKECVE